MQTIFHPFHPELYTRQTFGFQYWEEFARWVIYNIEGYKSPEDVPDAEVDRVSCAEDEDEIYFELITVDGKRVGYIDLVTSK